MAFERAKVLKAAERFLSQGKIESAIKEYRQLVDHDENDYTTLNMLGDLCVRANKRDEAISCFVRIAEHYRDQEFTLKAIAMYKKVDRLKPRDPEIARNLAALYSTQGLIVDARAQYLIVAEAYTRTGQTKQALEILRKIADLDPQNVQIRLKLASSYLKENLPGEAGDAFKEAGARLFETGSFEESLDAYSKALEIQPFDEQALSGVVSAHTALGTADEAAELLERTVAERPDDVQLISMLANAYISADDARGAERATSMLLRQDASNYPRFIPVAELYLKAGETDEAARVLEGIVEQMLAGREENDLLELVNEVLARNPEHIKALRLLVRIHWWQRDMDKLRTALERLAEAAEAGGLAEDERYALTQLLRLAPDENKYLERLQAIGGVQDDIAEEPAFAPESVVTEVPAFESFAAVSDDSFGKTQSTEFETNSGDSPTFNDPSASFADLNEIVADELAVPVSERSSGGSGPVEFDFGDTTQDTVDDSVRASESPDDQESKREAMMKQELESVDFYLNQGYNDIALDTLQMLEGQFGAHPEIEMRRQRLSASTTPGSEETVSFEISGFETQEPAPGKDESAFEFNVSPENTAESKVSGPAPEVASKPAIDSGLAEIFEEFREAAEGESPADDDYETHYNMGTAYKEMDLLDEAIQEFQLAAAKTRPGDGTTRYLQCCNMLGHCFVQKNMPRAAILWFRKALDAPGHTEDEYLALRYELGSAYEQLGDIGRAIDVFTEVYGVNVSYRGVAERLKELDAKRSAGKGKRKKGK
jgi:tetratricopeptide (TPR) repeat protein